jgi:LacI family transcriptional regulator
MLPCPIGPRAVGHLVQAGISSLTRNLSPTITQPAAHADGSSHAAGASRLPKRPTIADLAREAGVSVATVDRVLNRRHPVRGPTAGRVLEAAQRLGYHATNLLQARLRRPEVKRTFGFLLQKSASPFYRALAADLEAAARSALEVEGEAVVAYAEELDPRRIVEGMRSLADGAGSSRGGRGVDALGLVSVDHPRVAEEIDRLRRERGIATFALLSDLSAPSRAGYVGLDARKAGRTAAWAITRLARRAGPAAIFVGSHRYLDHDLREMSLKTYLRELAPDFRLLEPVVDLEDPAVAYDAALGLLKRNPDLVGIYSAGGGTAGIAQALRERGAAGGGKVVFACNELTPESRSGLIDGVIDLVIATPTAALARRTVDAMIEAAASGSAPPEATAAQAVLVPFDLLTAENF